MGPKQGGHDDARPDTEEPLMRVYIINADDLIVSRETPVEPGENEIFVASLDELRAARLSGKPN
jgi:hypothetical protein